MINTIEFPATLDDLPHPDYTDIDDVITYQTGMAYGWGVEDFADWRITRGVSPSDFAKVYLWMVNRDRDHRPTVMRAYRWFTTMGRTDR